MEQSTKRFPLREAYSFAEQHGLSAEATAIREMEIAWERHYNSTVRRGRMIQLLEKQGVLRTFIDQGWPFGRSPQGKAEMRHCLKVSGEYDTFLAAGESSKGAEPNTVAAILKALHFAAEKHRDQRRKDVEASPYINHPIEVAELLARVGRVTDLVILQSAILHDTIEDTKTTPEELEAAFGAEVRYVVQEVTDDKTLQKEERKQLQIDHAHHLSERAKQIKIADKISNVLGVTQKPPADWSLERRQKYLAWTKEVVKGCRGCNAPLESFYDQILNQGLRVLRVRE